jgi:prephenate dehydrogenase/chorismate mutase/prephenate dehydrogenase
MKILIIGSQGRLGKTLMEILPGSTGIDIADEDKLPEELKKAEIAFLAVPLKAAMDIINTYPDYRTFIELTSVKSPMRQFSNKVISLHPMFGPLSYKTNKDILFISDISPKNTFELVSELFKKYNIISMTSFEHDKLMEELLIKPYILSYISDTVETNIETTSHKKLCELSAIKYSENPEIMFDTIKFNNNSLSIIENIEEKLKYLKKLIGDR